jgi:hypothetical protein
MPQQRFFPHELPCCTLVAPQEDHQTQLQTLDNLNLHRGNLFHFVLGERLSSLRFFRREFQQIVGDDVSDVFDVDCEREDLLASNTVLLVHRFPTASLGVSVKGGRWQRPGDTFGLASIVSCASRSNQQFLAAGGLGILAGDSALSYGSEKALETYYSFQIWKTIYATVDYQFVSNPAFNRDRGPVSVLGGRLHWEL